MTVAQRHEADAERILVLDDDPEICELTHQQRWCAGGSSGDKPKGPCQP